MTNHLVKISTDQIVDFTNYLESKNIPYNMMDISFLPDNTYVSYNITADDSDLTLLKLTFKIKGSMPLGA